MVVFAPAGAGKTERLSRRYIELLLSGVPPERILTLTFTEKAAAEMKERIFLRLEQEHPDLHRKLRDDLFKVRISTIHSFCFSLLKRFAPVLELDPRLEVLASAEELWSSVKYDTLMQLAEAGSTSAARNNLLELVTQDQVQGWTRLSELFDELFARRSAVLRGRFAEPDTARLAALARELRVDPIGAARFPDYSSLFPSALDRLTAGPAERSSLHQTDPSAFREVARRLSENALVYLTRSGTPLKRGCDAATRLWNEKLHEYGLLVDSVLCFMEFRRTFELFRDCFLVSYIRAKQELGQVDYDDMELLALDLLQRNPEWQNVLYAFDEHTDHLLVDEFQDTNFIQWGIVDKLTEEWRSGEGAKPARGIQPTVFIVGDDKQSIYMFRNANVEVFAHAADRLERWLGHDRFERLELEDNYRSLAAIIDFTNVLFSRLMAGGTDSGTPNVTCPAAEPWQTRYRPFRRARNNPASGTVEIILDELDAGVGDRRLRDATNVCRRILSLVAPESEFRVFERSAGGEVARPCRFEDIAILLRQRTHLAEVEAALRTHRIPFVVIGGTGFYDEPEIRYLQALLAFLIDPSDDVSLYVTLRGPLFRIPERDLLLAAGTEGTFLLDRIQSGAARGSPLQTAASRLRGWVSRVHRDSLSAIVEQALVENGAWRAFWEPQREANVRKFLRLLEERESGGEHPLRTLAALSQPGREEEKAEVPVEGRDAVRVVTIHSAKGLEFPVVFVPGLDETVKAAGAGNSRLVIEETSPDKVLISYLREAALRKKHPVHVRHGCKELEEEKRVFYVACTRARDALFLSGIWSEKTLQRTRLQWLIEHLGLTRTEDGFELRSGPAATRVVRAVDVPPGIVPAVPALERKPRLSRRKPAPVQTPAIRSVSRYAPAELGHPAASGHLAVGDVIHSILESVATSSVPPDPESLEREARRLLSLQALADDQQETAAETVIKQLAGLRRSPAWDVILPQPDSFAELPVLFNYDGVWHSGRLDRVILTEHEARIYDYKTFPADPADLPRLSREFYDYQLRFYAAACRDLFPNREVSTWLVFTDLPEIVRCPMAPAEQP